MDVLITWLPMAALFLLALSGTAWLAHEMGEQVGYEHGRNHEHDLALLRERRVYAGDQNIIDFANTTTNEWSN